MNNYYMTGSSYNKILQPGYTQLTVLLLSQMYMSENISGSLSVTFLISGFNFTFHVSF